MFTTVNLKYALYCRVLVDPFYKTKEVSFYSYFAENFHKKGHDAK